MTELEIPLQTLVPKIEQQPTGEKIIHAFRMRQLLEGNMTDSEGNRYEIPTPSKHKHKKSEHPEDVSIWDKAAEHTIAAMYVADTLGEALGLSENDRSHLCQAALLHDSEKKTEQMWFRHLERTNPKDKTKRGRFLNR